MATIKKILANRANAKKSTGPKTNLGKIKSSQNAIKHGLNAEKFVVIGENINDLNVIKTRLTDELKPCGMHQEIIVSKLIDIAIRLRRIPVIEAGILNHEMLEYEADEYKEKIASSVEGSDAKDVVLSSNTIIRKYGLGFARDCGQGSSLLKLNTIEDKLLSKYFKLLYELKREQNQEVL